jgi:septal ring factor EnvC (AmiA/AmiB activator)
VEIDRTREPAQQMEQFNATVKGIEDERKRVIAEQARQGADRAHRAKILAEVTWMRERQKPTKAEIDSMSPTDFNEWALGKKRDREFLADNAEIIAEVTAAKAKAEAEDAAVKTAEAAEKAHQNWLRLREQLGRVRIKVMLEEKCKSNPAHARYEDLFTEKERSDDPVED